MGIAAADHGLAEAPREIVRQTVRTFQHLAVDCFNSVKIACKNGEIVFRARPGEAGIEMIYGDEEPIFDRIGEQALDVVAAPLQFDMVVFRDSIYAGVHFGTARHGAGDFFAQEEVGIAPQIFNGVDGIVICNRDEVHAALFQPFVQRVRLVVRLQTNAGEHGYRTHPRVNRVNVEIAPHAPVVNPDPLQIGDFHTKQL